MKFATAVQASIISFVIAAIATVVHVLGYIDSNILLVVIGLLGFPSLGGLLVFIDEKKIKPFVFVGIGALGIVGLLTGIATPEQVGLLFSIFGLIGGGTVGYAVFKLRSGG